MPFGAQETNIRHRTFAAYGLAVLSASPAWAQSSSLTVYGRLNTGIEHVKAGGGADSQVRLSNYRSVLGFRGEEALGGGLKAIFQLEGSVALDTGGGGSFSNRDSRVGLAAPWGTLFFGVWALPYTTATSLFDPFYPTTAGYMAIMGNGSAPISDNLQDTSSFDRRQSNQVQYWSPKWAGLSGRIAYGFNEETVAETGAKPWLLSGSINYEVDHLLLTLAHERHEEYQTRSTTDTATKVGAAYTWGAARVAAVLERLRYGTATGSLTRNAWYLSGTYKVGQGAFRLGYSRASDGRGPSSEVVGFFQSGADTGGSQVTVGYERELSKRTAVQAYYSRIHNDRRGRYDFAINELGISPGQRPSAFALGLRHSF